MPERRTKIVAWATAGVIGLSGIGFSASKFSEHTNGRDSQQSSSFEPYKRKEQSLPDDLPPAVAKAANAALDVERNGRSVGSGVKIDNNLSLTARHVVTHRDDLYKPDPQTYACNELQLKGQNLGTGDFAESVTKKGAVYTKIHPRPVGALPDGDLALLETPTNTSFSHLPHVELHPNMAKEGELVFFINYMPDEYDTDRTPDKNKAVSEEYTKPAIFGGRIYDVYNEPGELPMYVVSDPRKSYGSVPDTKARPGISGGMMVDAQGKLLGLSISGEPDRPIWAAATTPTAISELKNDLKQEKPKAMLPYKREE